MRALAVAVLVILAGCATPCPPAAGSAATEFDCDDGSSLAVTFAPTRAQVVQEGYVTLTLPAHVTGSGYRYAQSGAELRGRGSEVRWSRPGAAETICRATR